MMKSRVILLQVTLIGAAFAIGYVLGWTGGPKAETDGARRHTAQRTAGKPMPSAADTGASAAARAPAPLPVAPRPTETKLGGAAVAPKPVVSGAAAAKKPVRPSPRAPAATAAARPPAGRPSESAPAPDEAAPPVTPSSSGADVPASPSGGAAPRIAFESTDHDFGTVTIGDAVEHEFVFRNVGDAPLVIEQVRTSCGCTGALVTEKQVAPGGEGRVKATFRTTSYKGDQRKSIYVETNDPEQPRVTLALIGYVMVEVEVSPATIYVRDVTPDESRKYSIVVKRPDGKELRITKLSPSRPEIHLGEPQQRPDGTYEIEVTLGPGLPAGRLTGQVTIETNSERQRTVTVRVYGNVKEKE
ncbi:MAG: DUF1573 domain-containing protein [Armatimonadota bacterium]|nr:MAG: DUF1573 domain-containing protein [Armatimonadota bacterium]